MRSARFWLLGLIGVALVVALGIVVAKRLTTAEGASQQSHEPLAIPVEVAPVERGPLEQRRVFSGALAAVARITVAPKVAGRIVSLRLEIADPVERGTIVARLDDDEFTQSVLQAEAELAVAQAGLTEAESAAGIATRELDRVGTLHERGIASDSQLDTVQADHLAKDARVQVARAQVKRAEAMLQSARIRLGYTTIRADWEGAGDRRVVAERFVEEGDTVSANTPLLSIIELDPIKAVVFATEREYALLEAGQTVTMTADAYPQRRWTGRIARVAPVFREGSRQARVEITAANGDGSLKPGMFVRVQAVLRRVEDATIVPVAALAERGGRNVVFVADTGRSVARMVPVDIGIRDGDRVQVTGGGVEGQVVILGQQLLGDDSQITIVPTAKAADR